MPSIESIGAEALSKTKLTAIDCPSLTACAGAAFAYMQDLQMARLDGLLDCPQPLFTDIDSLTSLSLASLSSIGSILGAGLPNVVKLALPQISSFRMPLASPTRLPTSLSALDLASINYDDFVNSVSAYVARGFAPAGCSLTCSDGVFVVT